jgi:hypothetical protein
MSTMSAPWHLEAELALGWPPVADHEALVRSILEIASAAFDVPYEILAGQQRARSAARRLHLVASELASRRNVGS